MCRYAGQREGGRKGEGGLGVGAVMIAVCNVAMYYDCFLLDGVRLLYIVYNAAMYCDCLLLDGGTH